MPYSKSLWNSGFHQLSAQLHCRQMHSGINQSDPHRIWYLSHPPPKTVRQYRRNFQIPDLQESFSAAQSVHRLHLPAYRKPHRNNAHLHLQSRSDTLKSRTYNLWIFLSHTHEPQPRQQDWFPWFHFLKSVKTGCHFPQYLYSRPWFHPNLLRFQPSFLHRQRGNNNIPYFPCCSHLQILYTRQSEYFRLSQALLYKWIPLPHRKNRQPSSLLPKSFPCQRTGRASIRSHCFLQAFSGFPLS